MDLKKLNIFSFIAAIIFAAACMQSCSTLDLDFIFSPDHGNTENISNRVPVKPFRNVFLVYSMGFNDLNSFLKDDIKDLTENLSMTSQRDLLLIFSHFSKGSKYSEGTCPTLTKVYKDADGIMVKDTLMTLPETTIAADKETLREVLTYVKDNFDSETYGILLSSHGSGWAPEGYITKPEKYESQTQNNSGDGPYSAMAFQDDTTPVYNLARPGEIPVKSMGVHFISSSSTIEMDINEIAEAFPFKMNYIIFDACYMGCVEVAYELRNVTDMLVSSQTEILAYGMDYKTMTSYIYDQNGPDLRGLCERYFEYYDAMSGQSRSATISLVDCRKLEELAQVSKNIFSQYRDNLNSLQQTRNVQRYFRDSYDTRSTQQWFYDFGDIVEKCGISEDDLTDFNEKLNEVVTYKAATANFFMSQLKIEHHSGLSMYLPFTQGRDYLNNFYRELEWNKATGLLE